MTLALSNKKILVTRPLAQAHGLINLIQQQGGQVVVLPTLQIENITGAENPALPEKLRTLTQQAIAIFVSQNAVYALQALLQQYAIAWPKNLLTIAVGTSTARALATLGVEAVLTPMQFNSEAVLALPVLQKVQARTITIFSGEGGRALLAESLRARGAILTELFLYRRLMPPPLSAGSPSSIAVYSVDLIICTSNAGLQNLCLLLGATARNWLLSMPLLVISARMAQYAPTLGFTKPPVIAANATDPALLTALLNFYSS